jgi:hypothetical protein
MIGTRLRLQHTLAFGIGMVEGYDLVREAVGCIPPSRRAVTPHQRTGRPLVLSATCPQERLVGALRLKTGTRHAPPSLTIPPGECPRRSYALLSMRYRHSTALGIKTTIHEPSLGLRSPQR